MSYYTRIHDLFKALVHNHYTDLIISNPTTIAYLLNYQNLAPGERLFALHLNKKQEITLYLNRLFPAPNLSGNDYQVIWYSDGEDIISQIAANLDSKGLVGIDKDWPSKFLLELASKLPNANFVNGSFLSDQLRGIKSLEEQDLMLKASALNDEAMNYMISLVSKGLSEKEMINLLAQKYKELDCNGFSFDPIIAYGKNGANPHHETNEDTPKIGDSVVIDIGSYYKGYASDMTRTVFYGEPSSKAKEIYQIVKAANQAAIQQVKPGNTFASVDKAARAIIEASGFGEYFTHRTGHSIGIEVHEPGDVSSHNHDIIQVGNVFSIEPGIYLPGELGVRIEDLVIVTADGCRVINQVSKELTICGMDE